jgi:Protein of unknown function (DUF2946)
MDDIVKAALKKWPHVPHCVGWLGLDARGDWWMRDERAQAAGPWPQSRGSVVRHDKLREFIHRNFERDAASGAWFFQNGPQRVYVELEVAPWVWRLLPAPGAESDLAAVAVHTHTGRAAQVSQAWVDELGRLFLSTDLGLGLVHAQDMDLAADVLSAGRWTLGERRHAELLADSGDLLSPQQAGLGHPQA